MTNNAEKARTTRIAEIIRKSIQRSDNGSADERSLFAEAWGKYLLLVSSEFR